MKSLSISIGVVLLAVGLAAAQTTGGDKAAVSPEIRKSQPPDPLVKTTTHKKRHVTKKKTATDGWQSTGGSTGAGGKSKKTATDSWEGTASGGGGSRHHAGKGKTNTPPDDWTTGAGGGTGASGKSIGKSQTTSTDDWMTTSTAKPKKSAGKKGGKKTATNTTVEEKPGVPPPTRPTDPK